MAALAFGRPSPDADDETVAAWYEAKARLHQHLAEQGGPESVRERAIAGKAYERSRQLRAKLEVA